MRKIRSTLKRTLHLVDLENLLGDPFARGSQVIECLRRYLRLARWEPGDIVVVAGHEKLLLEFALRKEVACRIRTARGPDGADLALLREADPAFIAGRFTRMVIGSGDGIFADLAYECAALGVEVAVVSRQGSLSARLRPFSQAVIPGGVTDRVRRSA